MKNLIYFIGLLLISQGCTPSLQPSSTSINGYNEDLSAYRPQYTSAVDTTTATVIEDTVAITDVVPTHHITDSLNHVLDSISVLSQQVRYVSGHSIQVYSGNNREAANIARGKLYSVLDNAKPNMFYNAPNFKVQVGQFYSTLEANATFAKVKEKFPHAILVVRRFKIDRETN